MLLWMNRASMDSAPHQTTRVHGPQSLEAPHLCQDHKRDEKRSKLR